MRWQDAKSSSGPAPPTFRPERRSPVRAAAPAELAAGTRARGADAPSSPLVGEAILGGREHARY